jgi:DMSO/TMAO reductase YedYZ molybdopterin-dependent catalytic subunit
MSSATLDRLLATLVLAVVTTGAISLFVGAPAGSWIFLGHDLFAGALSCAVVLKVRRSVPRAVASRRWARLILGLAVTFGAVAALVGGFAWVAAGSLLWVDVAGLIRWSVLTVHAWIGIVLLPLVVVHLAPRRWRLLRPSRKVLTSAPGRLISRRSMLVAGGLSVASIGLVGGAAIAERLRGVERRFTGSRWLPAGGIPPSTTFLGEGVPAIDVDRWRLAVSGPGGAAASFSLDDLKALGQEEIVAVLDCTSGWALETAWRGVRLSAVLDAAGASTGSVEVRSVTGWSTTVSPADARAALLAWSVAGQPLPLANGAPLRLVLPDHRGLEWVKWLSRIHVA